MRYLFQTNNWTKFVLIHDGSTPWNQYKEAADSAIAMTNLNMVKSYAINSTISDRELQMMFNDIKTQAWGMSCMQFLDWCS